MYKVLFMYSHSLLTHSTRQESLTDALKGSLGQQTCSHSNFILGCYLQSYRFWAFKVTATSYELRAAHSRCSFISLSTLQDSQYASPWHDISRKQSILKSEEQSNVLNDYDDERYTLLARVTDAAETTAIHLHPSPPWKLLNQCNASPLPSTPDQ